MPASTCASRLPGASLADGEAGALSIAEDLAGGLSLVEAREGERPGETSHSDQASAAAPQAAPRSRQSE